MQQAIFYRFGIALFIGILVGLQREHVSDEFTNRPREMFAGVRTFALMSLAGCTAALVTDLLALPVLFIGFFLLMGGLVTVAYFVTAWHGEVGMTTEMAAIMTILLGALCYWDQIPLAAALGVTVTALLSFKLELHRLAERLTQEDIIATLKFAIITIIVLPLLPNQSFWPTPFDVLNPYNIWLMVILISGISFLGYILMKMVGTQRGIGLTGFLGGIVSSTAVTLSFSQRSHKSHQLVKPFALAIMLAWTIMFGRILIEVATVNPSLLQTIWQPMAASGAIGVIFCTYFYFSSHSDEESDVQLANPFELKPAVQFGLIYAAILLIARTAHFYFGETGIYVSSVISGLADVDAITISMAEFSKVGTVDMETAGRAIILATMSNTIVKGGMVFVMGFADLKKILLLPLSLIIVVGLIFAFYIL